MTAELPLRRFQKYPDEKVQLGFTFRVPNSQGVTLVSAPPIEISTRSLIPGSMNSDVPISDETFDADKLRVEGFFGPGGVPGEEYLVKVKGNRSDGQQPLEQHIIIYIKTV